MKELISAPIRQLVRIVKAAAPSETPYKPTELWGMVLPVLKLMQLHNLASAKKSMTKVHLNESRGPDRLYEIYLSRESIITGKVIERIKLHEKDFHSMRWNSQAIQVFVWGPYQEPEAENPDQQAVPPNQTQTPVMP